MKRCPKCRRDYVDDTLLYCLEDGSALVQGSVPSPDEPQTAILHKAAPPSEAATRAQIHTNEKTPVLPSGVAYTPKAKGFDKRLLLAPLALAVIVLGGFWGYRYFNASEGGTINSIAVLPFENRSGNADSEYLSDGLAESLIYRLSQLPDLKVSPTSSVMRYKGKGENLAEIADELGVRAVMTGKIVQRADNLTISIELIDVPNNKLLWGEQYERKLSELLSTQREIAAEITNKLQLKLSGEGEQKLTKKYTDNNEAYQLYLKGRFFWNKRTGDNLNKAIEQFKAAADKDPNFALAYAGLADCHSLLPYYSDAPQGEFLHQAKAYATRAVAVDDSLGEVHISLAYADYNLWNWAAAEKEFKRGLELNPTYATGHKFYGQYLEIQGRYDEAMTEIRRAQELEPLSLIISANMAEVYLAKGDADAAAEICKRVIELDPNWYVAHQMLALSYVKLGRNAEALAEAEAAVELSNRLSVPLSTLGYVLAQTGKRSEALEIADELKTRFTKRQATGYAIAWTYIGLNDRDETFRWLEKDFENRDAVLPEWLALYPLNTLRDEARYKDLRKRMNLPE